MRALEARVWAGIGSELARSPLWSLKQVFTCSLPLLQAKDVEFALRVSKGSRERGPSSSLFRLRPRRSSPFPPPNLSPLSPRLTT